MCLSNEESSITGDIAFGGDPRHIDRFSAFLRDRRGRDEARPCRPARRPAVSPMRQAKTRWPALTARAAGDIPIAQFCPAIIGKTRAARPAPYPRRRPGGSRTRLAGRTPGRRPRHGCARGALNAGPRCPNLGDRPRAARRSARKSSIMIAACSRAISRVRTHDPAFARLRVALRSTLASLLTAVIGILAGLPHHDAPTMAAPGALFAMIAPLFLREARCSSWFVSLAMLGACAGTAFAAAAAVAAQPALRGAGSLLAVFIGVLCQSLGARAVGAATLTLVCFYLGLYLHPAGQRRLDMLAVMAVAPVVVAFVGRVVIPAERAEAPPPAFARTLPHGVAAAKAWAAAALRCAADLLLSGRPGDRPLAERLAHRLHRLAWRPALAATLAALLAMLAGNAMSEERSMWAVISTFVVFLGTTSYQGTRERILKRLAGTLAGAAASVLLITACGHQPWLLAAAIIGSVFGWAYYILHAYARGVFFITMLVGLLYGQLGFAIVPLARLRIEEVLAGCLISLAMALLLMPSAGAHARLAPRSR
ncbi:FUSC family protein [Burkholderia glumae]|nr:FUSC family protein [Burkholderia glumae]